MEKVKITSGKLKGKKIATPGGETHPMGSREKLALFNMIGEYLPGAQVLDAYAGSGALGIEALSRGAKEVLFVEDSHVAMRTINENCFRLGLRDEQVAFYRGPVRNFYQKFVMHGGTGMVVGSPLMAMAMTTFPKAVDVILADPPYDEFNGKEICRLAKAYLKDGGILVLSHPGDAPDFPGLELISTHQYARAHISVYRLGS